MSFWITGSIAPFDDTRQPPSKVALSEDPHINMRDVSSYRQGVEIRTVHQLYGSNQPKVWGGSIDVYGNINHQQNLNTLGQSVSFADFYHSSLQEDLPNFNPVDFLVMAEYYPLPVWTNQGPQQDQEAILEPLPISTRLPTIEGVNNSARGVRGEIDLQNLQILPGPSVWVFEQPFLDQVMDHFGDDLSGSILLLPYTSPNLDIHLPFIETTKREKDVGFLTSLDADFKTALLKMTGSLQGDNGLLDNDKLLCFGIDCYGPLNGRGILYNNWLRGS